MSERNVVLSTEFYSAEFPCLIQGQGTNAPTVLLGCKGITFSAPSTGVYTLTFAEDPGKFFGVDEGSYTAATVAAAAALTVVAGTYTPASPSAQATLVLTFLSEAGGTYAPANLAATTTAFFTLLFLTEGSDL